MCPSCEGERERARERERERESKKICFRVMKGTCCHCNVKCQVERNALFYVTRCMRLRCVLTFELPGKEYKASILALMTLLSICFTKWAGEGIDC